MMKPAHPPKFKLRPAHPQDAPVLVDLIRELAAFEKMSDQVEVTAEILLQNLFQENSSAHACLVESNGKAVAFALYFYNFSTFLGRSGIYLEDLYVKPEWRGFGLGKRLLEHLAKIAVERHCGRLEWSVLAWNQNAIEFYERLGAKPMSGWQTYRLTGEALNSLARAAH